MIILSIVIPQYSEDDRRVKPLLESIDLQRGIDFAQIEVIIVNDGSDVILSEGMLTSFENIRPIYLRVEHNVGPGLCRQAGLDNATGEYVTFCDADDMFHSVGVLSLYFETIKSERPNIIHTSWMEEIRQGEQFMYVPHSQENTWLHGKVFNRGFLLCNNLRFSDELLYHEDSYFNSNAMAVCEEGKYVYRDISTFVWTWHEDTITRRNEGAYSYESMEEFTHAIRLSCRWLRPRRPELIPEKVAQCLCYVYYCVMSSLSRWPQDATAGTCRELWEFYNEFREEFNAVPRERVSQIQLGEWGKLQVPYVETVTFFAFMDDLETHFNNNAVSETETLSENFPAEEAETAASDTE